MKLLDDKSSLALIYKSSTGKHILTLYHLPYQQGKWVIHTY